MNSQVYLLIKTTHLLMRNFFVLNSISIALSISTAWIISAKDLLGSVASFAMYNKKKDFSVRLISIAS